MKRLLICTLLLFILVPSVDARRKKAKSGEIQDGVYKDSEYGFSIKLDDSWKAKVSKAESQFRLVLVQKNYLIPSDYADAPDYTKVPRLVVYADTTSMGASDFVDSLLSDSYKSDQKNEVMKEFEILYEPDLIPRGEKMMAIGEERGKVWKGQAKYTKEVATSASSIGGKRVYGAYGGCIVGVKKGDTILLFHMMCEWQYFEAVYAEAMTFINSLEWINEAG